MRVNYPNLLIIGAMKCGTTSLHDYLNQHPDIFMSQPKEIHYYDNLSKISRGEYLNHFKSDKKIIGTTPQSYTKAHHQDFKDIPEKIFKDSPNVKLIYIVRDPFERILSHALENRFGDSIERAKENLKSGHYWKTSLYYYQISQYLKFFDKSQIHLLTLEDLKQNKVNELNKIFKFLGVHEMKDESLFDYVKNDSKSKKVPFFLKSKLWYRVLVKLNSSIANKCAERLIESKFKEYLNKPKLNDLIDEVIAQKIRVDAQKLAKEFNLDISKWNLNPNFK